MCVYLHVPTGVRSISTTTIATGIPSTYIASTITIFASVILTYIILGVLPCTCTCGGPSQLRENDTVKRVAAVANAVLRMTGLGLRALHEQHVGACKPQS